MEVQPERLTQEDLSLEGLCSLLGFPCGIENYAPASPAVFSCDQSSYQYSDQQHLQENRTSECPQRSQGRYRCAYCPYSSDKKTNISRQQRIHKSERPFICNYCGRSFTQKHHLADHSLVNSGQKPHVCGDCGRCFSLESNLVTHRKEQHSAKCLTTLHMCGVCGKAFKRGSNLNSRMLTRSRQKPHPC